ncbi:MAG: hypothetical protein F6J95_026775 [Leptolyngbya sp. SIO1E4]|nr:hypothetical protein [Leptolyngbya sp. SIO1E4]
MKRRESRSVIVLKSEENLEISISSGKNKLQIFKIVALETFRFCMFLATMYYFGLLFLGGILSKEEIFILMTFPLFALTLEFLKALFDLLERIYIQISSSEIFAAYGILGVTFYTNSQTSFRVSKITAYPISKQQTFVWGKRDLIYKPFLIIDLGQNKIKLRNKYISVPEIEKLAALLSENLGCPLELEYLR